MARFNLSDLPKTEEEMKQFKEQLYVELTADYEKNGMAPVLAVLAQVTALLANQTDLQQGLSERTHEDQKLIMDTVRRLLAVVENQFDTQKVQIKSVSQRLEALEGKN